MHKKGITKINKNKTTKIYKNKQKRNDNIENYLDRIPNRGTHITWEKDDEGRVTLSIENKGRLNKIAQKLFNKPKVSFIHLDEIGSYIWTVMDGAKNIQQIGEEVEKELGEQSYPLYERLATYMNILDSYGFIEW